MKAARIPAGTLPRVAGDAGALRSALLNILGNAVKYSAAGGTVDVSATVRGNRVRLSVVDRGLGIDRVDLPHIFKPFYRGRRAVDAQVRGTGVGLSVVRNVIDAHRGEIHVDSRPGAGTTVTIELPAVHETGAVAYGGGADVTCAEAGVDRAGERPGAGARSMQRPLAAADERS
jgi:two-component system sensor histidine kinase SenX3